MLIDCQMLYTCSTVRCVSVAVCSPCVMVADSRTFCLLGPVLFRLFNMTLRSFSKPRSKILKKHRKQSRKKKTLTSFTLVKVWSWKNYLSASSRISQRTALKAMLRVFFIWSTRRPGVETRMLIPFRSLRRNNVFSQHSISFLQEHQTFSRTRSQRRIYSSRLTEQGFIEESKNSRSETLVNLTLTKLLWL